MAVTANSFVSVQTPNAGFVEFIGTTDATLTPKSLYVAGTNGSDVYGVTAVNNGATIHLVTLQVNNSGGTVLAQINAVSVPANAGANGSVLAQPMINSSVLPGLPIDDNGNPYLRVNSGQTLSAKYATAQGTAETLSLFCLAADY